MTANLYPFISVQMSYVHKCICKYLHVYMYEELIQNYRERVSLKHSFFDAGDCIEIFNSVVIILRQAIIYEEGSNNPEIFMKSPTFGYHP